MFNVSFMQEMEDFIIFNNQKEKRQKAGLFFLPQKCTEFLLKNITDDTSYTSHYQ